MKARLLHKHSTNCMFKDTTDTSPWVIMTEMPAVYRRETLYYRFGCLDPDCPAILVVPAEPICDLAWKLEKAL